MFAEERKQQIRAALRRAPELRAAKLGRTLRAPERATTSVIVTVTANPAVDQILERPINSGCMRPHLRSCVGGASTVIDGGTGLRASGRQVHQPGKRRPSRALPQRVGVRAEKKEHGRMTFGDDLLRPVGGGVNL